MKGLFCLFDKVANEWLAPFVARTNSAAVRMIDQSFKGAKVDPHDFCLFKISDWCEDRQETPLESPITFVVKDYSEGQKVLNFQEDQS